MFADRYEEIRKKRCLLKKDEEIERNNFEKLLRQRNKEGIRRKKRTLQNNRKYFDAKIHPFVMIPMEFSGERSGSKLLTSPRNIFCGDPETNWSNFYGWDSVIGWRCS